MTRRAACPLLTSHKEFSVNTYPGPALANCSTLRPLTSARIAYVAAAAASVPPTATYHVTLLTYLRSSVFVVSSAQRYNTWQLISIDVVMYAL